MSLQERCERLLQNPKITPHERDLILRTLKTVKNFNMPNDESRLGRTIRDMDERYNNQQ